MVKSLKKKLVPLEDILKALGDPVRLSIVQELLNCKEEKSCGSFAYCVTKATFSHHLKILIDAGIIQRREEGTRKFMSLREEFIAQYPDLIKLIKAN